MTILNIQPDASAGVDTYINNGSTTSNYGSSTDLITAGPAATKKILIKFDLSSIPAGSIINSAILTLTCFVSGASDNLTIHRGLLDFFEGNGDGTAGSISGSTWARQDNSGGISWTGGAGGAAGTEYASTPTDTHILTGIGAADWDVTPDVQDFVDSLATNRGWWILQSSGGNRSFRSSDYGTAGSRPLLTIDYDEPGAISGTSSGTSTVTATITSDPVILRIQPNEAAGKDTYVASATSATFNFGGSTAIGAGAGSGGTIVYRGLIQFDISSIPANKRIVSAKLILRPTSVSSSTGYNIGVHRGLVAWFEGVRDGSAPSGGQDGSTWNLRNANGSVAWSGGAGGGSGTDRATVATDVVSVSVAGVDYEWDVTDDVEDWYLGLASNFGWWIVSESEGVANSLKTIASASNATTSFRPVLVVWYAELLEGNSEGTSTVSGSLEAIGYLRGTASGSTSHNVLLTSNEFSKGSSDGAATVSATIMASGYMAGNSFGDSTASADIKASYHSVGTTSGTSSHVAHIKGIFEIQGTAAGLGTLTALPSFQGQMRGIAFGTALAEATGYARAVNKASPVGCNNLPLFYLTDGTVRVGGQLNLLNFLSDKYGFIVRAYRPQIPQYKEGGRFSNSPQSQGRRLRFRAFDNAIDILEVSVPAYSQDTLIQFQQELIAFQEAAADYWVSEFALLPIYLVARAARETNTRYAVVHMISVPELENPYAQPFFSDHGAAFENLTIRIERGMWWSTPPGFFDCVEISSEREWTVSGWTSGS